MRCTKIIATLGPATDSPEKLESLIKAGTNAMRLNMSHGTHAWVRSTVANIRKINDQINTHTAILMDLQGPSIRTGDLDKAYQLKVGDEVEFRIEGAEPTLPRSTTVNYADLPGDVTVGDTILVDNGLLHLRIESKTDNHIHCTTLTDGTLASRRHINLPGVRLNLPAMTEKDKKDATLAAELQLDFIALSFVRDVAHVEEIRAFLAERSSAPRIISKIEDQEAVRNLNGIIQASDAVMVARGDLGIEIHLEELPIIQRRIVKKCQILGRRSIVATHMLESMIENPSPTRAEVTDVANAVFEQADAVMLSGESSVGKYPIECIEVLDRIARRIEPTGGAGYNQLAHLVDEKQLTCKSAVVLANSLPNSKILVFTRRGVMALHVSHLRPDLAPIYAFASDPRVCRSLALARAVHPIRFDFAHSPDETVRNATTYLKSKGLVNDNDHLVIVSDLFQEEFVVDSILLRKA